MSASSDEGRDGGSRGRGRGGRSGRRGGSRASDSSRSRSKKKATEEDPEASEVTTGEANEPAGFDPDADTNDDSRTRTSLNDPGPSLEGSGEGDGEAGEAPDDDGFESVGSSGSDAEGGEAAADDAGSAPSEAEDRSPRKSRGRERSRKGSARSAESASDAKGRRRRRRGSDVEELGASAGIDVLDSEGSGSRRGPDALQPGLALKDLLPFLRPPKTILVLGASTGNGHSRTASALFDTFKTLDRNLVVRQHDALELVEKPHTSDQVRELLDSLSRHPALYGQPFETAEPVSSRPMPEGLDKVLSKGFGRRLDQLIIDKRPDWVVCTHWLPLTHLAKRRKDSSFTGGVVAVVPDPDLHDHWKNEVVDHWVVPEDAMKSWLVRHEVESANISVTGVPVAPAFGESSDAARVRRDLGLDGQQPTVLLRPGGIGAPERVMACVARILAAGGSMNLVVLTGKNEHLQKELEGFTAPGDCKVVARAFPPNVPEIMQAADLLITRASPHTVAEACAIGLPLVLLRPSEGVEDRMADRLLHRGAAVKAYGEEDLDMILREVLRNRAALRDMKDAASRSRRPDAAHAAVNRIAKVVN